MKVVVQRTGEADDGPRAAVVADPRRPGRAMAAIWCWCGRFYTLTVEQTIRHNAAGEPYCPNGCRKPDCGKGDE